LALEGAVPRQASIMDESNECQALPQVDERRAELRVPASTLRDVRSRLIGGSDFALVNYTACSLYGQSRSRLLVGARISVRLATATLNAIVTGRVVRSSLTAVTDGVPSYEVAVLLEQPVDWTPETHQAAPFALTSDFDAAGAPVPVAVPARAKAE
jgi:hypothetical protein